MEAGRPHCAVTTPNFAWRKRKTKTPKAINDRRKRINWRTLNKSGSISCLLFAAKTSHKERKLKDKNGPGEENFATNQRGIFKTMI